MRTPLFSTAATSLLSLEKEKDCSPFSRALQIPSRGLSYDFRSRSSSFFGWRRASLGLGGKVLLLRLDSQVGQVSLGPDLDVVRRLLVERAVHIARGQFFRTSRLMRERGGGAAADSPEVPEPAHPRPLCLLEQQLVIGSLLGQLEVLLVPLLVLVGVGRQVVRDVPRQVRRDGADLLFDLVDEFRGRRDLVGRVGEAEVQEDADRRERQGAPERSVEAWRGRGISVSLLDV